MDGGTWWAAVHGVAKSRTRLSDFTFTFHFHALEKEMATHSSVLTWRIPGMGEPGGLPSMGSHRVGHDWSDLAVAELPFDPVITLLGVYRRIENMFAKAYIQIFIAEWFLIAKKIETTQVSIHYKRDIWNVAYPYYHSILHYIHIRIMSNSIPNNYKLI